MPPLCHAFTQHKIILLHLHSKFRYRHIFRQHVITLSLSSNNRPLKSHAYIQHVIALSRLPTTYASTKSHFHATCHYIQCHICPHPAVTLFHFHTTGHHTSHVTSSNSMPLHFHAFIQHVIALSHFQVIALSHLTHCYTFIQHGITLSHLHTTCHDTVTA